MKSNSARRFIACGIALAALDLGAAGARADTAPCSLLTTAQVAAAVGANVGAGQPITAAGCSWSAPHMIVTLSLSDGGGWEQMKAPLAGVTKTPVSGLGDDAIFSTLGQPAKQYVTLSVKKGNTAYLFKVYGPSVTQQMSLEKALAGKVLANL